MDPPAGGHPPLAVADDSDDALANSEVLTRPELMRRRSRLQRRLAKIYRVYYWALMEDLRLKHREYYWEFGKSPAEDNGGKKEERENGAALENVNGNGNVNRHHQNGNGDVESSGGKIGLGFDGIINKCVVDGCASKAMALTSYCHTHIMSDTRQTLYRGCKFAFKSSSDTHGGAITCAKPILRSTIPPYCPSHLQRSEKTLRSLLRKGGLSVSLSTKLGSKFHCVIAEYVRLIQSRRRAAARRATGNPTMMKDSTT